MKQKNHNFTASQQVTVCFYCFYCQSYVIMFSVENKTVSKNRDSQVKYDKDRQRIPVQTSPDQF